MDNVEHEPTHLQIMLAVGLDDNRLVTGVRGYQPGGCPLAKRRRQNHPFAFDEAVLHRLGAGDDVDQLLNLDGVVGQNLVSTVSRDEIGQDLPSVDQLIDHHLGGRSIGCDQVRRVGHGDADDAEGRELEPEPMPRPRAVARFYF